MRKQRRWPWYQQILDAILATVGIAVIGTMVYRNSYPINGILLALSCVNSILAGHVIDGLAGKWTKQAEDTPS
jgi:uncharacterized membrane protein YjjB (DUF3815 family)